MGRIGTAALVGVLLVLLACQPAPPRRVPAPPPPSSEELARRLGLDTGPGDRSRPETFSSSGAYPLESLDVTTLDGRPVSLRGFRGRWLLLDFFTTFAYPSQVQMPRLNEIRKRWKDKGLEVIGISMDLQGAVMVRPFLEELKIEYPVFLGAGETQKGRTPYGFIQEIPVTLLIDPQGRMVNGYLGRVKEEHIEADLKARVR